MTQQGSRLTYEEAKRLIGDRYPVYRGKNVEILYNRHKNRKNNYIVAAMYAMYCSGRSLTQVAKVYKKTRQAVYDLFRSRGYPLRSKKLKGLQILDGIRFTEMKGGYLRGSMKDGKRITMHKYIWEKHRGPVPDGFVIHHKDKDPKNNNIKNLELIPMKEMSHRFNPEGRNQFSKR